MGLVGEQACEGDRRLLYPQACLRCKMPVKPSDPERYAELTSGPRHTTPYECIAALGRRLNRLADRLDTQADTSIYG